MTASARVLDHFSKANGSEPIRILGASGQLGCGVPTPAFSAGLERKPHLIGCDMGSIDIGPYYLGSGELATALSATRRDLRPIDELIRASYAPEPATNWIFGTTREVFDEVFDGFSRIVIQVITSSDAFPASINANYTYTPYPTDRAFTQLQIGAG